MEKTQGLKSNIVVEGPKKSQERTGKNRREGEENQQEEKKKELGSVVRKKVGKKMRDWREKG